MIRKCEKQCENKCEKELTNVVAARENLYPSIAVQWHALTNLGHCFSYDTRAEECRHGPGVKGIYSLLGACC
jgi:hypothetical protein